MRPIIENRLKKSGIYDLKDSLFGKQSTKNTPFNHKEVKREKNTFFNNNAKKSRKPNYNRQNNKSM